MNLYPHQSEALELLSNHGSCAIGYGMGLGKTFIASEKAISLRSKMILVVCQKSKIDDWINHFRSNYAKTELDYCAKDLVFDLTKKKDFSRFLYEVNDSYAVHYITDDLTDIEYAQEDLYPWVIVGVINYDLIFRKPELLDLRDFTLILDESSMIQHSNTKRTDFIMKMKPAHVILLSGTFTNGRLENLWTQAYLTGYNLDRKTFESMYCIKQKKKFNGRYFNQIIGYKNEEYLFRKLRENGWIFKKTDEAIDLPPENFIDISVPMSKEYKKFKKDKYLEIQDIELIGDMASKRYLYYRLLSGLYSSKKIESLEDLINSTDERVIIFYSFKAECELLESLCKKLNRPVSYMNGSIKDMSAYEDCNDSVTLIQYQSGSFGLNLQKCCHTVFYTPPLSTEHFEQAKARTRRIGQNKPCFYYLMKMGNSIEERIYKVLAERRDVTNKLFEDYENGL